MSPAIYSAFCRLPFLDAGDVAEAEERLDVLPGLDLDIGNVLEQLGRRRGFHDDLAPAAVDLLAIGGAL